MEKRHSRHVRGVSAGRGWRVRLAYPRRARSVPVAILRITWMDRPSFPAHAFVWFIGDPEQTVGCDNHDRIEGRCRTGRLCRRAFR